MTAGPPPAPGAAPGAPPKAAEAGSAEAALRAAALPPGGWAPYLDPGERLLWEGQPAAGLRLRPSDWFMIPFSLLWGGFAIFWEAMALSTGAPLVFALFGLPFVALGLFLIVGRFFWDSHLRRHTHYALTDCRAIVARAAWGRTLKSYPIDADAEIAFAPGPEARIGLPTSRRRPTPRQSRGGGAALQGGIGPVFEFIPDGDRVYGLLRLVQRAMREAGG